MFKMLYGLIISLDYKMYAHVHALIIIFILTYFIISVVVFVDFGLSTYDVGESSENVKLDLRLSNPSSTDISVQVTTRDISANSRGMYVS